jgi:predicted MFS family arabinose efflux permease
VPGRILVDFSPLRESRDFRLLFFGQMVGTIGSQLTVVAIPYQVYAETHSSLQVGAVSLAQLGPLIVGALVGGSVGDAVDRRLLLLVTSAALALTSGALALNSLLVHPSLLAIYVVSALAAGLSGFANTARNAAVPSMVDRRLLAPAYAFMQIVFQVGTVAGPALAGVLIGAVHVQWVYGIDAITYFVTIVSVFLLLPIPPAAGAARPGVGSVLEGLRYLRGRQALQGVYLIDINAMVFGMPRALFPALTATVFHGGATTLGYLYAAPGAGALLGAATTGWVTSVRRQAWVIFAAVMVWGAAITAFGFSHVLVVSLVLLAVAGWADVISAVLRNTVLMTSIPEQFRSRISSIQMAVVQGGPRLGDLEAGAVATAVSTDFSIISGGLACMVGAVLLLLALPGFRRFVAEEPGSGPPA